MKKLLALLLAVVSVLGLTACQKTIDDDQYSDYNQQNSGARTKKAARRRHDKDQGVREPFDAGRQAF